MKPPLTGAAAPARPSVSKAVKELLQNWCQLTYVILQSADCNLLLVLVFAVYQLRPVAHSGQGQ